MFTENVYDIALVMYIDICIISLYILILILSSFYFSYRQFPLIKEEQLSPETPRKFMCNLRATIYPNSSRSDLYKFLKNNTLTSSQCHVKVRQR